MANDLINYAEAVKPQLRTLGTRAQRSFLIGEHIDVLRWRRTLIPQNGGADTVFPPRSLLCLYLAGPPNLNLL